MKILALGSPTNGVSYHRVIMPLIYLIQDKPNDYLLITNEIDDSVLERGWDIVVLNRSVAFDPQKFYDWKLKYNFKLIVDNDDYWHLDPHHILSDWYESNGIPKLIKAYMAIADLVTVTHERLREKALEFNSNVHILPNALPYGDGQFNERKSESNRVRLFWSGSDTHYHDLNLLRRPMQRVYSDGLLRTNIKTVMAGYSEAAKPVWDCMASAFTHALKFPSTIYQFTDPDKYMSAYYDSDISIIPLTFTKFNAFKSNLKVLETACKRNPAIVSQVDPYLDLPVSYVQNQTDWYRHIKDLVNDEDMRKEKGEELYTYCNKHHNLSEINKKRYDIYSSVCGNIS